MTIRDTAFFKRKKLMLTVEMKSAIVTGRREKKSWEKIAKHIGVDEKWLRKQAKEMGMYMGDLRRVPKIVAVLGICATVSACGSSKVDTLQEKMVVARSTYLGAAAAFTVYAMQPWCDDANAPKPPQCADKSTVIEGANASRAAILALDSADAVIAAKGVPDVVTTITLVERFATFVRKFTGAN